MSDDVPLKQVIEAALMVAPEPLSLDRIAALFSDNPPGKDRLREVLDELAADCNGRSFELSRVASGYRFQIRQDHAAWIGRMYSERPARYSRALMETLAIIAYRQPVTRGDIEEVRGVAVSTQIIRTLLERGWVRVVGQREVPGRPALYGTTREFLDYFNLRELDELPTLAELRELGQMEADLQFALGGPADALPVKALPAPVWDESDGQVDTVDANADELAQLAASSEHDDSTDDARSRAGDGHSDEDEDDELDGGDPAPAGNTGSGGSDANRAHVDNDAVDPRELSAIEISEASPADAVELSVDGQSAAAKR